MRSGILPKASSNEFVAFLSEKKKVVGPVKQQEDQYVFEEVSSYDRMSLDYIPTILPPKKYFMPQHETLLEYDKRLGQHMQPVVEVEDLIIFGVHTCDLAGIQCLNVVFSDRPKDLNYLIRKNSILLIGLECGKYCDKHASCAMMGNHLPKGGYDLFLTDLGDYYFVDINTKSGEDLLSGSGLVKEAESKHLKDLKEFRAKKEKLFSPEVADLDIKKIPELFKKGFDSPVWEEIGEKCLSCGNCTNVCPTCYCFDVLDEPDLNLKTGKRIRVWDSCQNEPFAKIAGGESFRQKRSDRKRHRFNRKFRYPVERYGRFFCTGCGRCSRTCMAKIDLKETIEALKKEKP